MSIRNRLRMFLHSRPADKEVAGSVIGAIRRSVRAHHTCIVDVTHIEAKAIKTEIRIKMEEGGVEAYVDALNIWKVATKLYPPYITEDDKPTLIEY